MSERVSYEEQVRTGLVPAPRRDNFVVPVPSAPIRRPTEAIILPPIPALPERLPMPSQRHVANYSAHHDAISQAQASQIHARADIVVFGGITLALVLLAWLMRGGDLLLYGLIGLVVWGSVSYYALNNNRNASYQHSPAGVALHEQDSTERVATHEIDSRERIALHAIDRHADLIEKRWRLDGDK